MNKACLVGNLARDPEFGTTQSGIDYCRFTVACQRRIANRDGVREADFINCVAWRQTAEFVHKYFAKGSRIGLTGTIQTQSYTAQDGTKRYTTEVLAEEVEFAAPKAKERVGSPAQETDGQDWEAKKHPPQPEQTALEEEDDLPF